MENTKREETANTLLEATLVAGLPSRRENRKTKASGRRKKVYRTAKGNVRSLKKVVWGNFYVKMAKANMFVSVGDGKGNILLWESGGTCGYKGKKKASWLAGRIIALKLCRRAYRRGIREAKILVNGYGKGRRSAVRAIGGYLPPRGKRGGRNRRSRKQLSPNRGSMRDPLGMPRGARWRRRGGWGRRRRGPLKAFRVRTLICNSRLPHNGCRKPRKRHLRRRPPRRLIDLYAYLRRVKSPWAPPSILWRVKRRRQRKLRLRWVGRKGYPYPAPNTSVLDFRPHSRE
jgi:small subunit ribosomal protein S11